jgi:hypothetical protein
VDASGANRDLQIGLRYRAIQPPDLQPREFTFAQSLSWGATTGRLRASTVAFEGLVRLAPTRRAGGTLTAGVALERYAGDIESLAYTQFVLGGHATLSAITHRVRMAPVGAQTFARPSAGGDVQVRIAPHVAIVAGVRLVFGSSRIIRTQADGLVAPSESPSPPDLSNVRAALGRPALDLSGVRWRTLLGVRFTAV